MIIWFFIILTSLLTLISSVWTFICYQDERRGSMMAPLGTLFGGLVTVILFLITLALFLFERF